MKVKALKLQDVQYGNQWYDTVEDRWEYNDQRWIAECKCLKELKKDRRKTVKKASKRPSKKARRKR